MRKNWKRQLLPPDSTEDALWHPSVSRHSALPSQVCVTTISVILYCVAVALMIYIKKEEATQINMDPALAEFEVRRAFGMRNLDHIWNGAWIALFGSAGQHYGIIHLAFNMFWLYRLGTTIERAFGSLACLGVILLTAWVSSGFNLAVAINPMSESAGMSGVVYAMAGFLWLAWRREPGTLDFFNASTARFFLGWQVICFVLTWTGAFPIANTAHLSGLAVGLALGASTGFSKPLHRALGAMGVIAMAGGVFLMLWLGAPWNPTWHAHRAYRAQINFRFDEAERHYQWLEEHAPWHPIYEYNREVLEVQRAVAPELPRHEIRENLPTVNPFKPRNLPSK